MTAPDRIGLPLSAAATLALVLAAVYAVAALIEVLT